MLWKQHLATGLLMGACVIGALSGQHARAQQPESGARSALSATFDRFKRTLIGEPRRSTPYAADNKMMARPSGARYSPTNAQRAARQTAPPTAGQPPRGVPSTSRMASGGLMSESVWNAPPPQPFNPAPVQARAQGGNAIAADQSAMAVPTRSTAPPATTARTATTNTSRRPGETAPAARQPAAPAGIQIPPLPGELFEEQGIAEAPQHPAPSVARTVQASPARTAAPREVITRDVAPPETSIFNNTQTGVAGGRSPSDGSVDQVLFTRRSPELSVETSGPKRIMVGRPATYSLSLRNTGDLTAADVVVQVSVPAWAEVVDVRGSTGDAAPVAGEAGFAWRVGGLAGGRQEQLSLDIVPRESQPFELGVRWTYSPLASQATVEVQEPKLGLALSGPSDVQFGNKEVYRLTISNPGNGPAENVVIHLLPIAGESGEVASHRVGTMAPGDDQVLEIELTARQAGQLEVRAEATADGDLKAEARQPVFVRRAELELAVAGPKALYAGTATTYEIRVRNRGNATADSVRVSTVLPMQFEFLSADQGARFDSASRQIQWNVDAIAAGAEKVLAAKCTMKSPGVGRVEVSATADFDVEAAASATTQVLALADLTLDVTDPQGPVAVGDEASYVVRIQNQGTRSAPNVDVVIYFSEGIEPVRVEGGAHELMPGTVIIKPIANIAPNQDVAFTITCQAHQSGNHRMRAELQCKALGTKLSQEESTLFFDLDDLTEGEPATTTPSRPAAQEPTPAPPRERSLLR